MKIKFIQQLIDKLRGKNTAILDSNSLINMMPAKKLNLRDSEV